MREVCDIRPQKKETHITRLVTGGNILYFPGEDQHTQIRLNYNGTTCQKRHLRHQIKIHVHGRKRFLPEQPYGWSRIYHDTDIHDPTIIFRLIQPHE